MEAVGQWPLSVLYLTALTLLEIELGLIFYYQLSTSLTAKWVVPAQVVVLSVFIIMLIFQREFLNRHANLTYQKTHKMQHAPISKDAKIVTLTILNVGQQLVILFGE